MAADQVAPLSAKKALSHAKILRNTVAHMANRTTDLAAGAKQISPSIYLDPARAAAERRELFLKRPILAALTGDIPNPGDKLLFDQLGPAILIVRNKEGVVKAFLNMCTHRAARLVESCDARSRMTCRFHGWTFDLDGDLIGLPGKEGFDDIDRAALSLIPVPVAEWHGMIFVRATPDGDPIDVAEWLGPMADEMAHLELEKARPVKQSVFTADANWKYAYDTYGESYHFATLHPTTIGSLAFSNIMTHEPHGLHMRLGFPRQEFADCVGKPESEWPATDYGGLYMLFPNLVINVNGMGNGPGQFYGISRVFPNDDPATSTTILTTYRPGHETTGRPDADWAAIHDFVERVVTTEDYSVSASGQRNLAWAPERFNMVFGANEAVLQSQHAHIERILAESNEG